MNGFCRSIKIELINIGARRKVQGARFEERGFSLRLVPCALYRLGILP
ncbi:MAG TPA: hypothetical protein VJ373_04170 [Desulfatiglandales bacterium]|nr:hypothetical protein [Desulfatiglandales bacterium]